MSIKEIRLLGDPILRCVSPPVRHFGTKDLDALVSDMTDTLRAFRVRHGFGRGIAAPQIGSPRRVVVIDVDAPRELVNPVIVRRSRKTMTLWDDCFSFPDLLVKLRRALTIDIRFCDRYGNRHMLKAEGPLAELLQHEIDHLNGILALDRAVDSHHIVYRKVFERLRAAQGPDALVEAL
jgi:peptide deformylase